MSQERIPQAPPEPDSQRPYTPETPPEAFDPAIVPETRREILGTLTEGGWQRAKDAVAAVEFKKHAYNPNFLRAAAEMHDFDPVRFEREVKFSDDDWEHFRKAAARMPQADWKITYAAALKKLNPARFAEEKPISPKEWGDAFGRVWHGLDSEADLVGAHELQTLDPEEFAKRMQEKWPVVKAGVEQHHPSFWSENYDRIREYVLLAGLAEGIKPKGEPAFRVSQAEWDLYKRDLWEIQDHGSAPVRFFRLANAASKLRLK